MACGQNDEVKITCSQNENCSKGQVVIMTRTYDNFWKIMTTFGNLWQLSLLSGM